MKIRFTKEFSHKLNEQVEYIAKDKPGAARKFKSDLLKKITQIPPLPFKNRKSIFFNRNDIRDLTFKGYVIVYKINEKEDFIEVFGFTKYHAKPFNEK